jgi:hypothetical protein
MPRNPGYISRNKTILDHYCNSDSNNTQRTNAKIYRERIGFAS